MENHFLSGLCWPMIGDRFPRIPEWSGWKGPPWVIWSHSPAQQDHPRAQGRGLCPDGSEISPPPPWAVYSGLRHCPGKKFCLIFRWNFLGVSSCPGHRLMSILGLIPWAYAEILVSAQHLKTSMKEIFKQFHFCCLNWCSPVVVWPQEEQ